ncbi:MAG: SPOR domain-containing protein [Saprospiraceae bacterium]|nr:SPOR domain-containing protein [Saprospiraceae bacterium]
MYLLIYPFWAWAPQLPALPEPDNFKPNHHWPAWSPTLSAPDTLTPKFYIVSGSFLVPQNAEKRIRELHKAGYRSAGIVVFPESEFYAAVIDSFADEALANKLAVKLQIARIPYFIKRGMN